MARVRQSAGLAAVYRLACVHLGVEAAMQTATAATTPGEITFMGSVIKKRRKRMAKKKHRKLLRKTRVARRKAGK